MTKINLLKFHQLRVIDDLYNYKSLLDILINIEALLNSYNIYAYDPNWLKGEVVEGPKVKKYWVYLTLKFDYKDMPDPETIRMLDKVNIKVKYKEDEEEVLKFLYDYDYISRGSYYSGRDKKEIKKIWYVKLQIPRKLLYNDKALESYYDKVDFDNFDSELEEGIM